jgi:hypothetical protein
LGRSLWWWWVLLGDVITRDAGNKTTEVEGKDVVLEWIGNWDDLGVEKLMIRSNSIKRR